MNVNWEGAGGLGKLILRVECPTHHHGKSSPESQGWGLGKLNADPFVPISSAS